jgi:hypothetical protein
MLRREHPLPAGWMGNVKTVQAFVTIATGSWNLLFKILSVFHLSFLRVKHSVFE